MLRKLCFISIILFLATSQTLLATSSQKAVPDQSGTIDAYFDKPEVNKGETVTLYWESEMAYCRLIGIPGAYPKKSWDPSGHYSFTAEGDVNGTVICNSVKNGGSGEKNVNLKVGTTLPTINISFTNEVILPNKLYRLKVLAQNATSCQLQIEDKFSFFNIGTSYDKDVVYQIPGVYYQTVICDGPGGTATERNEVRVGTVAPPSDPEIHYFYNTKLSLNTGYTHLKWASSYAERCKLNSGSTVQGVHVTSQAYSSEGYQVSIPVGGKSFALTCFNSQDQSVRKSIYIPRN